MDLVLTTKYSTTGDTILLADAVYAVSAWPLKQFGDCCRQNSKPLQEAIVEIHFRGGLFGLDDFHSSLRDLSYQLRAESF